MTIAEAAERTGLSESILNENPGFLAKLSAINHSIIAGKGQVQDRDAGFERGFLQLSTETASEHVQLLNGGMLPATSDEELTHEVLMERFSGVIQEEDLEADPQLAALWRKIISIERAADSLLPNLPEPAATGLKQTMLVMQTTSHAHDALLISAKAKSLMATL